MQLTRYITKVVYLDVFSNFPDFTFSAHGSSENVTTESCCLYSVARPAVLATNCPRLPKGGKVASGYWNFFTLADWIYTYFAQKYHYFFGHFLSYYIPLPLHSLKATCCTSFIEQKVTRLCQSMPYPCQGCTSADGGCHLPNLLSLHSKGVFICGNREAPYKVQHTACIVSFFSLCIYPSWKNSCTWTQLMPILPLSFHAAL